MRLLIEFRAVMLCLAIVLSTAVCRAQISGTTSNPGQYLAIKKVRTIFLARLQLKQIIERRKQVFKQSYLEPQQR